MMELSPQLKKNLPAEETFDFLLNMPGTVHREVKNRRTVAFALGGHRYFIKTHRACGWGEILKQLLQVRSPIVSARTEWEAIAFLNEANICSMRVVGKGCRGRDPSRRESFLITEELEGMISLENLVEKWREIPEKRRAHLKRHLLEQVAEVARTMHAKGMNHRDFYLCHILVSRSRLQSWRPGKEAIELYLIDLHRAQMRRSVPSRWLVKDLGGLLFSALEWDLSDRDLLRFVSLYRRVPWRDTLFSEKKFWIRVLARAQRLYRSFHGREAPLPGIFRKFR